MTFDRSITAVARRGSARQWGITSIAIAATAALVWLWVASLPAPPRFSPLTIEPGAARATARRIVLEVEGDGQAMVRVVPEVEFDLAAGRRPLEGFEAESFTALYRVPIDLGETTFASFGADVRGCKVRFLRSGEPIEAVSVAGDGRLETGVLILPAGSSDMEIEVVVEGGDSGFRGWWRRDPDGPTEDLPGTADAAPDPRGD
ncbi:MAG: hypothetical protein CMJ52_03600 [Planctomycetaceae bacterium]|nr:hypothetical protein [Planctomycetaceae bacterium]